MDDKPYDSSFKTIAERNRELLVPMVNEFFGRHYPKGTKVVLLRDEHHVCKGKKDEWSVLDTDALFRIGEMLYHIECQSTPDGIIAIRMVEYGFHIAIDGAKRMLDGAWELRMPLAAVLYLRHNSRTPEAERVRLVLPDGSVAEYKVPIIKVQKYSLEELFRKKLLIMLPFYLFRYEKEFAEMEQNPKRQQKMLADVREMESRLEAMRSGEFGYAAENVSELVDYVSRHLLEGYEQTSQEVSSVMGGKLIETKAYKAYLEGEADGEARGETKTVVKNIQSIRSKLGISAEKAMDILEIPKADYPKYLALL